MSDDELGKFLEENAELFSRLASGVMCPACKKVAHPPLANLGKAFHWAEGHPACVAEKANEDG